MYSDTALLQEYCRRFGPQKLETAPPWCPQTPTPKQAEFLELSCFEALFGGSAGPGKSSALLMAALRYADIPGYAALILRKTYADLARPGALMDRAHQWLGGTAARWNGMEKKWRFPSGATLSFGHLEHETAKYNYQGAEFQCICVDEATQITATQYLYLISRLRRLANSEIPLRMRAASNPGGISHEFFKNRFVDNSTHARIYVPATLSHNPHLDQDSYRAALSNLDSITRRQLLDGEWIMDNAGLVYRFDSLRNVVELPPSHDLEYILGIDLGAAQNKPTTAFCIMAFSWAVPHKVWCLESTAVADMIPSTIAERIKHYDTRYNLRRIVADAGALGKGYVEEFRRRYALPVHEASKRDKLGYRKLLNGALERGELLFVADTNMELIQELKTLQWDTDGLDTLEGSDDHRCLIAGTMIHAQQGLLPIENLKTGDQVYTRRGLRRVVDAKMTGIRPIWRLQTKRGHILYGTSNHPIHVEGKGWVSIDSLAYGDRTIACQNSFYSTEKNTADIQIQSNPNCANITHEVQVKGGCIAISGYSILDRFLKDFISTIKMGTTTTTQYQIWNAFLPQSICAIIWHPKSVLRNRVHQFISQFRLPPHGTHPPKASNGTVRMGLRVGETEKIKDFDAKFAESHFGLNFGLPKCAPKHAMQESDGKAASTTRLEYAHGVKEISAATNTANKNFAVDHVLRVIQTQIVAPVYNLTVEIDHEYFANNILVSNSDAMTYAWREARQWLAQAPENIPPRNTPEHAEWQARKMKDKLIKERQAALLHRKGRK